MRKMLSCMSGEDVRISTMPNVTRKATPPAMHRAVPGFPQPQIEDCWKPSTLSATPSAMRTAPR